MTTEDALPVLTEDGSRLDWPDAAYRPEVRLRDGLARIEHRIERAPALERLLAEGAARWAIELRCPKTLLARIRTSAAPRMEVRWEPHEVDGQVYLIPGLLAMRDVRLETDGLNALWSGRDALDVPEGWWLARGQPYPVKTLGETILSFREDRTLPDGAMKVASDQSSGQLGFIVSLAPDVFPSVERDRSMQVAGLIGVCALFPTVFGDDADEQHRALADEIRGRLEAANVPAWDDGAYDPARAATAIEPLFPLHELEPVFDDE